MKRIFALLLTVCLLTSLCACGTPATPEKENKPDNTVTKYEIGQTWTVDGQWSLVINSVTATEDRNEFAETNPAAVYIIDYTYTNIGYTDASGLMDGLFFNVDETIVDSKGIMGYSYPGDIVKYAKETPVGATCNAEACIGVDNAGSFEITVIHYDGNSQKQSATFSLNVE